PSRRAPRRRSRPSAEAGCRPSPAVRLQNRGWGFEPSWLSYADNTPEVQAHPLLSTGGRCANCRWSKDERLLALAARQVGYEARRNKALCGKNHSHFLLDRRAELATKAALAFPARWRSGYAEDCKSLHAGSIPARASISMHAVTRGQGRKRSGLDPSSRIP